MVGAEAGVFGHPAAELGEQQHHHVVGAADALQVGHEAGHRVGGVGEQPLVQVALVYVRIEGVVAEGGVIQPRRHVGMDQRGDLGQVERHDAVVDRRAVVRPSLPHQCRGVEGALGDVQQVVA